MFHFAGAMLLVMGTFSSRVIAMMYINSKNPDELRVARLTFFGSRVDYLMPSNAFHPITDSENNPGDVYINLHKVDSENLQLPKSKLETLFPFLSQDKFYISLRYGIISHPELFKNILGDVSEFMKGNNK